MQYRAIARFLPSRWLLIIASSGVATATTQAERSSPNRFARMSSTPKALEGCEASCPVATGIVYKPGTSSVAYVTTPDMETAKKLARGIVERKLAACVNIVPQIESIYMWEGTVNEDSEYLLMIKTRTSSINALSRFVRANHPYSVAEVISLPIENGNPPYLKWIEDTVPAPEKPDN
ncbi:hypothetical protein KR018_004171, partial [Drosophila ironensis]